jgi:hypothetical protein
MAALWLASSLAVPFSSFAFNGRIAATVLRGGTTQTFLYTIDTNQMRIERVEKDRPYPSDIIDLGDGSVILLFPHNRSFVHLKNPEPGTSPPTPGMPAMPMPPGGLPPGVGPQTASGSAFPTQPPMPVPDRIGPTNLPDGNMPPMPPMPSMPAGVGPQSRAGGGMSAMPMMPPMPPMPMERAELRATGETTNLLGYTCTRYELKQRGEVMEIWATGALLPFQPYLQNQPHRFGPRMMEEQWGELLKAKKLFPLLVVLRFENGSERMRFEVKSVTPEKIKKEDAARLFQPPPEYQEIQPLPF